MRTRVAVLTVLSAAAVAAAVPAGAQCVARTETRAATARVSEPDGDIVTVRVWTVAVSRLCDNGPRNDPPVERVAIVDAASGATLCSRATDAAFDPLLMSASGSDPAIASCGTEMTWTATLTAPTPFADPERPAAGVERVAGASGRFWYPGGGATLPPGQTGVISYDVQPGLS